MQCPIDGTDLVMADRSGVEIDYCPKCRGVWLDRGELDKIIERSAVTPPPPPPPQGGVQAYPDDDDAPGSWDRSGRGAKKKRRGGFLEDLFDFDL